MYAYQKDGLHTAQVAELGATRRERGRGAVERQDCFARTDLTGSTIVCNPPYGIRLGRNEDLGPWLKRFGDHLKRHCLGATAFVYFGDRQWPKHVGLRPDWEKPLKNGGLDGRLARFSLCRKGRRCKKSSSPWKRGSIFNQLK